MDKLNQILNSPSVKKIMIKNWNDIHIKYRDGTVSIKNDIFLTEYEYLDFIRRLKKGRRRHPSEYFGQKTIFEPDKIVKYIIIPNETPISNMNSTTVRINIFRK